MSLFAVRECLKQFGAEHRIKEFKVSSAIELLVSELEEFSKHEK